MLVWVGNERKRRHHIPPTFAERQQRLGTEQRRGSQGSDTDVNTDAMSMALIKNDVTSQTDK